MEPTLVLRPGREKSVRRHHPWIFSGGVARVEGSPAPGDTVRVVSATGDLLGRASYAPASQLRARLWTFDPDTVVDDELVASRVVAAAARRSGLAPITDAARLVFSEADGVPGVIADRYGESVVVQMGSAGADRWREVVADALFSLPGVRCVYERSDIDARQREDLAPRTGLLRGNEPDAESVITERDLRYAVGFTEGQKTGFYLDQRNARDAVARVAEGRRVLNAFSYTGAFGVIAARHGAASVTSLDSSGPALAGAARNAELNGVELGDVIEGDAFAELRTLRDRAKSYDLIMLDPPKLAQTEAQVARATRAYKDLNLLAAKLLAPGGILMTFSCSGGVSTELFQKVVAGAALDAKRDLRIVGRLDQPSDHPVPLAFPEAAYLKGLVLLAE
ncbi:MAG: SAM-dependent methyltransferase [Ilumatobacteraceae bacterium]|nr:SAM-dependent methyltransferase [Ilumatobacteraceae bacterium]